MTAAPSLAVIGGGIAGVSVAYALSRDPRRPQVVLLEAEPLLAYHTTGRSAAQLIENYGSEGIRPLTRASLPFLRHPPTELVDAPLLHPRALLTVGSADQSGDIDETLRQGRAVNPTIVEIGRQEAMALFPAFDPGWLDRAVLEPEAADIDVAGLHQAFVRGFRANGGVIVTSYRVVRLTRLAAGRWQIEGVAGDGNPAQAIEVDLVVNGAGAWGDRVASAADVEPIGLQPLRRTAFMVASRWPGSWDWPLVADAQYNWYVKPDGSQLLCSPADEQPSEPCDAKPEELDIAIAIDRINTATTLGIRSVASSWAGLRTFVADRSMVIGPDPDWPSFVWCVGQGGTGIQTAPAAGQLVADLVLDGEPGPSFARTGLDLGLLLPDRLR